MGRGVLLLLAALGLLALHGRRRRGDRARLEVLLQESTAAGGELVASGAVSVLDAIEAGSVNLRSTLAPDVPTTILGAPRPEMVAE